MTENNIYTSYELTKHNFLYNIWETGFNAMLTTTKTENDDRTTHYMLNTMHIPYRDDQVYKIQHKTYSTLYFNVWQ